MLNTYLIWIALIITVFGNIFYLRDTLKGETQPNRVTFLLWGVAPLISYFSQRTAHADQQIWFTLVIALMPLIILVASFVNKKAYWKITKFDIGCGTFSAIALAFLIFTGNVMAALILSLTADLFAGLPTIIKSYKYPKSETGLAYAFEIVSSLIVLLTVQTWRFVDYIFPAYILTMNIIFTILIVTPRKKVPVIKLI